MKKFLIISLVGLIAGFAAAQSNVVSSANIVGYVQVHLEPGGQYTLATCNFEAGETNTLLSIFGTDQLTQNDSYLSCDRIFLYDAATQGYQAWAQWTDGVFYKANDAEEWNEGISGNPEIPVGSGFFISSGNASNTISLSGDVIAVATQNVDIVEGFQILGNPFSTDIDIQDTGFADSGAAANDSYLSCDRIHVYEDGQYQAYALWTDGVWYKANDAEQWNEGIAATNQIALSQAFFYEAQGDITWSETNAYLSVFE